MGRGAALAVALLYLPLAPIDVHSQTRNLVAPELTTPVPVAPGTGSPGATLVPPPLPPSSAQPLAQAVPVIPAGHVALAVSARYGRDAPPISGGLIWRVFAARPDATGVFRLL